MANSHGVIDARQVTKKLRLGKLEIAALRGVDMCIEAGEMVSIVGPSGSGKSTLLGIIGGLDTPTSGEVYIDGVEISRLGEDKLTEIRNEKIGFIFQFFNLIPTLTALENVALPIEFANQRRYNPKKRAKELLEQLGLGDRLNHRPSELSGGQQQRVAIARALANNPPLLLADEPTGNLDSESGAMVMETLHQIRQENGTTIVLVTHDPGLAKQADRILTLIDGRIEQESLPEKLAIG
ncbi:MAG: ABC transporter ATP-binding protein [Chloroflexi bacterium]|nr:MAG: ABC transporter ATP-binding protein [Chloroflexota bacterium]